MKNNILFACLAFILYGFSQTTPTLKTTMDWIVPKLDYCFSLEFKDPNLEKTFNPNGCTLQRAYFDNQNKTLVILRDATHGVKVDTTELPLNKLDPCNIIIEDISIKEDDPKYKEQKRISINLKTLNNKYEIKTQIMNSKMKMNIFKIIIPGHILSSDPDIAEKLKKALINAIKQCGGKCEVY